MQTGQTISVWPVLYRINCVVSGNTMGAEHLQNLADPMQAAMRVACLKVASIETISRTGFSPIVHNFMLGPFV